MRRLLVLGLLLGGIHLLYPLGTQEWGGTTLLAFGFLILAAYTVGELARAVGLPKIVGYLAAGVIFGPAGLQTVTALSVGRLGPVSQLAVALIAFLAGAELRWKEVRDRGITLLKMTVVELSLAFIALAVVLYALMGFIPFLSDAPQATQIAAALLFASVAIVHSPAVTMAVLSETEAHGTVARTTLGVVLIADVVVVILFSIALTVARNLAPPVEGAQAMTVGMAVWEIGGALLVGALLGGAVALYLRFVGRELVLFAVLVAFFGAEIARVAHVELLLTLLTAGFVTENVSTEGDALRAAVERSAAPVFVVFFALSGAKIDLPQVVPLLPLVLPLAAVRAAAIFGGTRLGGRWAGAEEGERRLVWMGLVSQAGVAIGLAAILSETYGEMGLRLQGMLLALIAVNETVGPILFRRALSASGEVPEPAPLAGKATT